MPVAPRVLGPRVNANMLSYPAVLQLYTQQRKNKSAPYLPDRGWENLFGSLTIRGFSNQMWAR